MIYVHIYDKNNKKVIWEQLSLMWYTQRQLNLNLLSITTMIMKGWKLHIDENALKLVKESMELRFDIKIKNTKCFLFVMKFQRKKERQ